MFSFSFSVRGQPCPNIRCTVPVVVTCECLRLKESIPCDDVISLRMLRCTDQCSMELRNARLRDALNLDEDGKSYDQSSSSTRFVNSQHSTLAFYLFFYPFFSYLSLFFYHSSPVVLRRFNFAQLVLLIFEKIDFEIPISWMTIFE